MNTYINANSHSTVADSDNTESRLRRNNRVKALLAGGLVLGLGAAVTLAVWNDSEFATATFTTGSFNLVGSADGTTFTDHSTLGTPAALTFTTGFANLSPNTTMAAPYVLHLDSTTTVGATGSVNSVVTTGAAAAQLTYGVIKVASVAACTPTATGAVIVPTGTAMSSVAGASTFALAQGTAGAAGADVFLCIRVTSGTGLVQNTTATGTWEFLATSTS